MADETQKFYIHPNFHSQIRETFAGCPETFRLVTIEEMARGFKTTPACIRYLMASGSPKGVKILRCTWTFSTGQYFVVDTTGWPDHLVPPTLEERLG